MMYIPKSERDNRKVQRRTGRLKKAGNIKPMSLKNRLKNRRSNLYLEEKLKKIIFVLKNESVNNNTVQSQFLNVSHVKQIGF